MKTESDKTKLRWFMGGLAVCALVINCFFIKVEINDSIARQRQQRQEQLQLQQQQVERDNAAAALKSAAEAVAAHAQFLAQHLTGGYTRKPGIESVAVAVASEDRSFNHDVTAALAHRFKTETVETLASFFKPAFVSDGLIDEAFEDSNDLSQQLELNNSLGSLLLAREDVKYSTNPSSLENVITATMRLEVLAMPVAANIKSQKWTFSASGAGFKKADARAMAEERLIKQITNDTNMVLSLIPPYNQH